jgi:hypothetical protein
MSGLALAALAFPVVRSVNVHQAKTQFSRLIDAAHAGETIVVAKDGEPKRQPGVLKGQLLLPASDDLLAPLPIEELDAIDEAAFLI